MNVAKYRKAGVAVLGAVMTLLVVNGVFTAEQAAAVQINAETVISSIIAIVTAVGVYSVPNSV